MKYGVEVMQGLSRDPKTAAIILFSKGFISSCMLEEIIELNATRSDNGQKLYRVVLDVVRCFPGRYTDFIPVLAEIMPLKKDFLSALKKAYYGENLIHIFR